MLVVPDGQRSLLYRIYLPGPYSVVEVKHQFINSQLPGTEKPTRIYTSWLDKTPFWRG